MLRRGVVTSIWFGVSIWVCLEPAHVAAAELPALEQPALEQQDTIVVTADQAWESQDGEVLNFKGNFELHGVVEEPSTIIANGNPVKFWVQDESGKRTHGEGVRLKYDRERNLIRLSGKAILRDQYTVMRSSILEYDIDTRRLVGTGTDGVEIVAQPNRD
jgi:lipopolysaccharide transport protein LptA